MFATPAQITTRLARKTPGSTQWRSQVKVLGVANRLTLSEQRYFVWDTAPQSTERQDVLEIWETWPPAFGSKGFMELEIRLCFSGTHDLGNLRSNYFLLSGSNFCQLSLQNRTFTAKHTFSFHCTHNT